MDHPRIIAETERFVRQTLAGAEGGHDWFHILRVRNLAKQMAATESVDFFIVEMGALLHDIADSKFYGGDEDLGPKMARDFLEKQSVSEADIVHIEKIIQHISFKGGNFEQAFRSPELDLIQDADRLDAMGAIGIARCFNYGGFKNRPLYDPEIAPQPDQSKEAYKKSTAPSINHFYEKLLRLKDRMNTDTGRRLAVERHQYMEGFLRQFYNEWAGNC